MAYCTIEDVLHELHPTLKKLMKDHYDSIHTADSSAPDFEQTIIRHIAKAEACANASLARAYRVPIRKATDMVTSAVCKIAAYFASAAFTEKEQILSDKYETALLMLDNLVKAKDVSLVDADVSQDDGTTETAWGSDSRIFTSSALEKW